MPDVHCSRCGETWSADGVRHHTTMAPGEARPVTSSGGSHERFLADVRAANLVDEVHAYLDELDLLREGGGHHE